MSKAGLDLKAKLSPERECIIVSFIAVTDACTLFAGSLRDTLFRAATEDLYQLQITEEILEELHRNLIKTQMSTAQADRLSDVIRKKFRSAFVTHHLQLIPSMTNNEKDRHVLAAAVACRAQVIVTHNLKHFPQDALTPYDIEAQSPDAFLLRMFYRDRDCMKKILFEQANFLRDPPKTVMQVIDTLEIHVPMFANLARKEFEAIKHSWPVGVMAGRDAS